MKKTVTEVLSRFIIDTVTGCHHWTGTIQRDGYGMACFSGKSITAHRLSYEKNIGSIPNGLNVLHHCDNRACIKPEHLWLGTQLENMRDMAKKGRSRNGNLKGDLHPGRTLTASDVVAMRTIFDSSPWRGLITELAKKYGVSVPQAHLIVRRKSWRHLP